MASGVEELFDAVKRGSLQELRQLLSGSNASQVECRDAEGNTLLHIAADKGDYEMVTELIKLGAKPLVSNTRGDTPLHLAALNGRKAVVKGLQTVELCRFAGHRGRTVLHCACEGCPPEVVGELITVCKSDVMAADGEGQTPLHVASACGKEKTVRDLVSTFKCNVECVDSRGNTPLLCACQNDQLGVVKLLIKQYRASLSHVNAKGETALDVAAANGKTATVELLVTKFGCSPTSQTRDGRTPLHSACTNGFLQLATELVTKYKCNVNAEDGGKVTPLHLAAQGGNALLIDLLVANRATVDGADARGCTALHYAAQGGHKDAVSALCRYKADRKARNSDGRSALDMAALNGHVSVVEWIVGDGSDPNEKDATGRTCLHHAACGGHKVVVELLVPRPTDKQNEVPSPSGGEGEEEDFEQVSAELFKCPVDSIDLQGKTPLHCACEFGHVEVVRSLLGLGADMKARDNVGNTGLHMAASNGHTSIVHILVSEFVLDPGVKGCDGRTALHNASLNGHTRLVEALVNQYKSDVVAKDDRGSTPLHLAAANNKVGVVAVLLVAGRCPPDVLDSKRCMPLHRACEMGHVDVVRALVEAGASATAHNMDDYAPLHLAILNDKVGVVELLTTHGCNPADPAFKKKPLHLAASRGRLAIMDVLVRAGCGVTELDEGGLAPIHVAATGDQGEAVRELVATFKCPVNLLDSKGNTALHHAAEAGRLATVRVLHSQGVNLDMCNKDGDAALHVAAFNGHGEVLKALVKFGCSINYKSGYKKRAPLHYACDGGHLELVRDLVRKFRCDVGMQDQNGLTPVHVAVVAGKIEVVRELVEVFKCSLVAVDSYGCTPLRYACWGNSIEMVRILCGLEPRPPSPPTASQSNESCPSPEPSKDGVPVCPLTPVGGRKVDRRALHYACEGSTIELVRELIGRYMFDVNEQDPRGWVPLHMAAQSGKEEIVQELLALITHPVDQLNSDRQTPLLLACEKGCVGAVKLLLSRGANPELKDGFGRNGIMKAMEGHHDQVMEVMVAQCGWKRVFENITDYTDEHKKKYTETLHKRKDKFTSKISQFDKELKDTQERCRVLEGEVGTYKEQCQHYKEKLEEYTQMNISLLEEKKRKFEEEKLLGSPVTKKSSGEKSEQDQARRLSISAKYKGMEQRLNMVDQQIKKLQSSALRSGSKSDLSSRCPSGVESAPDLTDLLNMVVPHIQGRLSEVGLQLGLTREVIEAIMADPSGQHWTKLFEEWKEKAAKPYTWATLLSVLGSPEVQCSQQAQALMTRIMGGGGGGGVVMKERTSSVSKTEEVDGPTADVSKTTEMDTSPTDVSKTTEMDTSPTDVSKTTDMNDPIVIEEPPSTSTSANLE